MIFPVFVGAHVSQAQQLLSVSSGLGGYPVALSTRRTWALHSQTILEARPSAPCSIRLGTSTANRHPPN